MVELLTVVAVTTASVNLRRLCRLCQGELLLLLSKKALLIFSVRCGLVVRSRYHG